MRLTDELRVDAPLQSAWTMLLDVPRVARALPGASIDSRSVQGEYRGQMKVKLGPVTAQYTGVAALQDVDDDEHVASYRVQGREVSGQGTAEATITVRARADGCGHADAGRHRARRDRSPGPARPRDHGGGRLRG